MLSREQNVQECDATRLHSSNTVGLPKIIGTGHKNIANFMWRKNTNVANSKAYLTPVLKSIKDFVFNFHF